MKIPDSLKRYGLAKVYDYLDKDPMNNMGKVMDLVNKFAGDTLSLQREAFDKVINDKDSCWHQLIEKVWTQTDPSVLKTIFNNFFVNANLVGWPKQEELRKKYGCNIPWAILLDPTSACNLHCTGCWAAEYGNKLNLTFDEIDSIITQGKELGIYLYIYTGGEPLVRKNVAQLVAGLKATPGIRRVTLTTNAVLLAEQLSALLDAGLDSVNISLDTLRPEVFRQITARDDFAAVQAGLQAALESGLPVKLNCVPQAGINEGELEQLAALAKDNALQVRFIEMMPIGYGAAMPCISGPELRARFARRWPELAPLSAAQEHALGDGPAVYYTVPGWQGSIGFIAAVHGKFCASCNRVRLTSQGFLRPCLASETGCDLRALLRSGADDAQLLAAIRETIWAKPREHHFNDSSMPATRGMYRIGG